MHGGRKLLKSEHEWNKDGQQNENETKKSTALPCLATKGMKKRTLNIKNIIHMGMGQHFGRKQYDGEMKKIAFATRNSKDAKKPQTVGIIVTVRVVWALEQFRSCVFGYLG